MNLKENKVNKQQVNYAVERMQQVKLEKVKEYKEKYPKPKKLSNEDKLKSIRSGKAKLKRDIDTEYYTRFYECFEFPEQKELDKHIAAWDKAFKKFSDKLDKIIQESTDELYLGDTEVALKAIQSIRNVSI
jgi:hypothetical protein